MKIIITLLFCFTSAVANADYLSCPCKVVKVLDGNTVYVLNPSNTKHKIGLAGIDAPEKKQVFGNKSSQNLFNLVAGKHVEVEYSKRDRYGQIIGKLINNGQDVNLLQLKQGYAWHDKNYQKEQSELDRILYSSAEIEAREKTIGLWSVPAVAPWEFRKNK
ncbi:MAG: endonuclease YncB(thermonuclease family) [Gammaproteobacteria bacterium]|jgi:endonuclease YncB( thermonuclease family)